MMEYIKNAKAYKLQNRHISSRFDTGHMTQFFKKGVKGQGHKEHIMHIDNICLNSVPAGPINFILKLGRTPYKWDRRRLP